MRVKKYLGVSRTIFSDTRAFTLDFYARLAYYPIQMVIIYFLWSLLYGSIGTTVVGGFSFTHLISYFMIQRICSKIFAGALGVSGTLAGDINSGNLSLYLCRPVSYLGYLFASILPPTLISGVLGIPVFILLAYVFSLPFPTDAFNWCYFGLSIGMAFVIVFAVNLLIGLSAFWIREIRYLNWVYFAVVEFISGAIIPISLYPQWFQTISKFIPFQYIYFIPLMILFGKFNPSKLLELICLQTVWVVLLLLVIKFVWNKGLKVFDAQGG